MAVFLNDAGVWKHSKTSYFNDGGIWKPIRETWNNDAGTWKRSFRDTIEIVQAGHEANVVLRNKVAAAGGDFRYPMKVVYRINPGVWVYGTHAGGWALNLADFPAGSDIHVVNSGYIAGAAGNGGGGGGHNGGGGAGSPGSHALLLQPSWQVTQRIENWGSILGGGGGGGGGAGGGIDVSHGHNWHHAVMHVCGGGGGAARGGFNNAFGQVGGTPAIWGYSTREPIRAGNQGRTYGNYGHNGINATAGGAISGGRGTNIENMHRLASPPYNDTVSAILTGGAGGHGGEWGNPGAAGGACSYALAFGQVNSYVNPAGGPGGAAGAFIGNHPHATWIRQGDLRGQWY